MPPDHLRDRLQSSLGAAYRLERALGGGGMARVLVATGPALGPAVRGLAGRKAAAGLVGALR